MEDVEAELEQALDDLRVSEENYRSIFEAANDAIYIHNVEDGNVVDVNQRVTELLGYTPEEICKPVTEDKFAGAPPYTLSDAREMIKKATEGEPILFEWLLKHKSGRLFWAEINLKRAVIGGQPRLLAIVRDIDERKRAENALREHEELYRTVLEAVDDSINIKDAQGRYLMVNSEFCRRMERTREEILGKTVRDLYDPESAEQVERLDRDVLEKGITVDAEEYHPKRKRAKINHVRKAPLRNASGEVVGVVTVARDITERKRLEEQLIRAQRLETAGRVASQVAHDFNNLLAPLTAYPELIKMLLSEDHPAREYCDAMIDAAGRMNNINEDMLGLGRRGLFDVEPTDVNQLIVKAIDQLHDWPSTISIRLELDSNLLPVVGSPAQLVRVITNLLSNAREAMDNKGTIIVKTANLQVDDTFSCGSKASTGQYVAIAITDTGCGIPPELHSKVFEAFFTTKSSSKRRGCGLGLSIVQSIVEDHKGLIKLESEVGRGTTFKIYLPTSLEPARKR